MIGPEAPVTTFQEVSRGGADGASRLLDAVPLPLVLFDAEGAVLHANSAAVAAFGPLPPGMPLGLRFRAPELERLMDDVLAGRTPQGVVDHAERAPVERFFTVSASPLGAQRFLLVFEEHSEARRIDRMRADFIANASHELRTPLASIAGFVETLRGPARDDAVARERFLAIIAEQTGRMSRLIDDLLALSRLEMKAPPPRASRFDLADVAAAALDALAPQIEEAGLVLERRFAGAPFWVEGDRDELFQLIENLVENACRYGFAGRRLEVTLRRVATSLGEEVEAAVRDWGAGIAAEHIPRLTERFYRVDAQQSRSLKGTGLGLAIVKHILTRHRGRLSVESRPGEGANFVAHLPAAT